MFKRSSNVSDSQVSDSAVQRCQEVLQAFSSVTGDQTNRREPRDPSQLPVQVLPLILRQQVGFIQHQEDSVCGNEDRNTSGTVRKRVCLQILPTSASQLMQRYVCHTGIRMLWEGEDALQVLLEELCSLWRVSGEVSTVHNHKSQICLLQSERKKMNKSTVKRDCCNSVKENENTHPTGFTTVTFSMFVNSC